MRILITGAGRAIGAATATVLEQRGHQVVATARDVELLDSVPATLRLALDVRSAQSVRSALDQAGELDAIVNNAVITGTGPLEEFPIDLLRECSKPMPLDLFAWCRRSSQLGANAEAA